MESVEPERGEERTGETREERVEGEGVLREKYLPGKIVPI